jgi:ABC-2 type transport system permease protein
MTAFTTTINETRKGLIIMWDYKFSMLMELFGIGMIFIGITFFVGQGNITQEQIASTILGFFITFYAMATISTMSWALMNEAQTGTLEQMYMSPTSTQLIILGRSLASLVASTVQVVIVGAVILLLFRVNLALSIHTIPVMVITLFGLLGVGYLIGGLTLIFKQVGPIANMMQNLLLLVNGTFLPVSMMPAWMGLIVQFVPSTLGIILLRRVVLDGNTTAALISDGSLLVLAAHSTAFFVGGWILYAICERIARQQGSLGQY